MTTASIVNQSPMIATRRSRFVSVTYIRTTRAKLWEALTDPRIVSDYWFDAAVECDWKLGSAWSMAHPDGRVMDAGEILEIDPPRRMVIRWQNQWHSEFKAEGPSQCTIELEPLDCSVKLTVTHEMDRPESKLIRAVSDSWPLCLSNLKSLLETGEIAVHIHPGH